MCDGPKIKKRRGGNFFSLGGKNQSSFAFFGGVLSVEKNANVLCLWVGLLSVLILFKLFVFRTAYMTLEVCVYYFGGMRM